MRYYIAVIWILFFAAAPAMAQPDVGDIEMGQNLARTVCAQCHRVEKGQKTPEPSPATAFQEIAENPARTMLSMRVFLRTSHVNMPDIVLSESEVDDLTAYIGSLK